MKSSATPDFWESYKALPFDVRGRAKRAYRIWRRNPRHPSLHFKKAGGAWSVRIDRDHRALALREGDTLFWFWIGDHDEYERMLRRW